MSIDLQPDGLVLLLGRSDLGRRLGDRLLIRGHLGEGSALEGVERRVEDAHRLARGQLDAGGRDAQAAQVERARGAAQSRVESRAACLVKHDLTHPLGCRHPERASEALTRRDHSAHRERPRTFGATGRVDGVRVVRERLVRPSHPLENVVHEPRRRRLEGSVQLGRLDILAGVRARTQPGWERRGGQLDHEDEQWTGAAGVRTLHLAKELTSSRNLGQRALASARRDRGLSGDDAVAERLLLAPLEARVLEPKQRRPERLQRAHAATRLRPSPFDLPAHLARRRRGRHLRPHLVDLQRGRELACLEHTENLALGDTPRAVRRVSRGARARAFVEGCVEGL